MPATMNRQPMIWGMPMRSSNSQYDSASTERISRCDAAKAGPMGARLSKVIHEKKAPM